jgi:hypothetical protein
MKEAVVKAKHGWTACAGALLVLVSWWATQAADQPPKPPDQQVVDSKADKRPSAATIDFRKEYNLPLPSLGTLGARIESARRAPDPVSLGHAASELAVAEKVSGKKASLTSAKLIKEAAELASLRRQEAELRTTLQLTKQISDEQQNVTLLQEQIDAANKFTREEREKIQRNEEPSGAPRKILVNNYTTQYVDVYVNGYPKMQLEPGGSKWCVIEHKWNPTVLKAYGSEDVTQWGPRYIWGEYKTYTWNLN